MGVDYYKLLHVPRNVNDDELKKAAEAKLKQISDAYHVLSDPTKRAVYDQHAEEGLKRGAPPPPTGSFGMGGLHGRSPDQIFSELFGCTTGGGSRGDNSREGGGRIPKDIFSDFFGGKGSLGESRDPKDALFPDLCFGGSDSAGEDGRVRSGWPRKAAPIVKTLPCCLEELYKGTTKKMKISRDVLGVSGRSTVEEFVTIEIKPGWKKGTKITFPERGNDLDQGVKPADIVFIVDEKPHSVFKRDGDDLIVTRNISLAEALTGRHTKLTTLDGRNLVATGPLPNLTHEVLYEGEGMPIQKKPSKKGNLIMKFNIEFPKLTSEQKTRIKQLRANIFVIALPTILFLYFSYSLSFFSAPKH